MPIAKQQTKQQATPVLPAASPTPTTQLVSGRVQTMGGSNTPASSAVANKALGRSVADIVRAVESARDAGANPAVGGGATGDPGHIADVSGAPRGDDMAPAADTATSDAEPTEAVAEPAAATAQSDPDGAGSREGRLLADIRARERKLIERQQRHAREREEFDQYRRRTESELSQAREQSALAQRDPLAYLERYHGIRKEAFGVRAAEVPGSVATEQTQAQLRAMQERLDASERARAAQDQESARQRELDRFEAEARANASKYPLSSKYRGLRDKGWEIALTHGRQGVTLSNEEILDRVEEYLADIASLASAPKPAVTTPPKPPAAAQRATRAQPTLTNREETTATEPAPPTTLTRRQMIERTVAVLEQQRAASGK